MLSRRCHYFIFDTMTTLYWKCGCGKVQLELSAEPWSVANCHCHSCVASSMFLDEKYKGEEKHTSAIAKEGGAAVTFFMPNDVTVLTEEDLHLGCLKVGPKGKPARKYVKCCGTQFGVAMKAFWALNRNALYRDREGTQHYVPDQPVGNSMKRFAFDQAKVPEPSASIAPLGEIFTFACVVINPFGQSTKKETMELFEVDASTADEVPITWE